MKLMILGASQGQLSGIIAAKKLGHHVVTLDYLSNAIGHRYSDEQCSTSTFDIEGVVDAGRQHQIDGVMTLGTDQPVLSGAVAAKRLQLPQWISEEVALSVTNKRVMKGKFVEKGIPTATYILYTKGQQEEELVALTYPVVVKPVDSQGQRGIFYLETPEAVRTHYDQVICYSRQNYILVETYYPHEEVTVSGWVVQGECTILTVTDRVTFQSKNQLGICLAHHFPSKHMESYGDAICHYTKKIVQDFNIKNGPIYFQYLIGDDGIKVNEIACRIGGAHEAFFIPKITGFNIVESQIALALGHSYKRDPLRCYQMSKNPYHVSVELFFVAPTTIAYMTPLLQLKKIPGVADVGYHVEVGACIEEISDATQRGGYAVIIGETKEAVDTARTEFYKQLRITDAKEDNYVIRYKK